MIFQVPAAVALLRPHMSLILLAAPMTPTALSQVEPSTRGPVSLNHDSLLYTI